MAAHARPPGPERSVPSESEQGHADRVRLPAETWRAEVRMDRYFKDDLHRRWRRGAIALIAAGGGMALLRGARARAQSRPGCVVRPEQTEGPYFVDTRLARSDIRSDPQTGEVQAGVPLALTFRVSRMRPGDCEPLPEAHVEVWQCNASGLYSSVQDRHSDTRGQQFLRGHQATDANGIARFTTIYPGWYPGRTVHIHFMIRAGGKAGARETFTSQLYFDDALPDAIFSRPPYSARGPRSVRNAHDGIYRRGGRELMLAVSERDGGLAATFDVGLRSG
jgi:protocatechuate 3,4-dioxygenase beta subunit